MAIAFCRVSIHSRKQGHSAVAGAAYRAGAKLFDERTGETFNFENRAHDVLHQEVLLPNGADPAFQTRALLWNEAERMEKRKDAQIAKDIVLALPKELNDADRITLTREFAEAHFVSKGLAADIAIHAHSGGNPHAHIYVTTRRLKANGFDRYKARDLNPRFAKGRVSEQSHWGDHWRQCQTQFFRKHQLDIVVDANHLIAQVHEGRVRENAHYQKTENALRREASEALAEQSPRTILTTLTDKQTVFTHRDLAKLLHKTTNTPAAFQQLYAAVLAHESVIYLGTGQDGRDTYTTIDILQREKQLQRDLKQLNRQKTRPVAQRNITKAAADFGLSHEQTQALTHIMQGNGVSAIVGRAGTGKSYLMKPALQLWQQRGFSVHGIAVSGIAAKGLEQGSGIPSMTIHAFKHKLEKATLHLDEHSVVVMDEAGMTDQRDMAAVLQAVAEAKAQLVLVGDHDQLQPVGPGAPFKALLEKIGFAELQTIRRQQDAGDRAASHALSQGNVASALAHYEAKGALHGPGEFELSASNEGGKIQASSNNTNHNTAHAEAKLQASLIQTWKDSTASLNERLILTYRNQDVAALNQLARKAIKPHLGNESYTYQTEQGPITLAKGDRLLCLKNNYDLGVRNGDFVTVTAVTQERISVQLNDEHIDIDPNTYKDFTYGYAATVHKTQGITIDEAYVYVGKHGWDRFLTYVALTRHRHRLDIFSTEDKETLAQKLAQGQTKDNALDFTAGLINPEARRVAEYIDLHRQIGEQAGKLREQSSNKHSPAHTELYAWTRERNALATQIDLERDRIALSRNRVNLDNLKKHAEAHHDLISVKDYLEQSSLLNNAEKQDGSPEAPSEHLSQLAQTIANNIPRFYPALNHLCDEYGLDIKATLQHIKDTDHATRKAATYHTLSEQAQTAFDQVEAYHGLIRSHKAIWKQLYQAHEKPTPDNETSAQLKAINHKADSLAFTLHTNPLTFKAGVDFYQPDADELKKRAERYEAYHCAHTYNTTKDRTEKLALAALLIQDRRYYRAIYEAGIDWKQLSQNAKIEAHREQLRTLNPEQQRYYRLVRKYETTRLNTAIAWGAIFKHKEENRQPAPRNQVTAARTLTQQRNRLAYEIAYFAEPCRAFIEVSRLPVQDIEKHALKYIETQRGLKPKSQATHTKTQTREYTLTPRSPVMPTPQKHLDYQTIHDALIQMSESFYTEILGDDFKRHGNQLRYGRKGSLTVTTRGPRAGSWHSFETDDGGGPIQLLTNSTYGYGLSFKAALEKGAQIAGISAERLTIDPAQRATQEAKRAEKITAANKEAAKQKQKRIQSARYYWESSQPINGTIGERYLREHRNITGDLSAFRFHPKIRDDYTDQTGQHHTHYHPGIIIAAKNEAGNVTACQTIILDPDTANKVDKAKAGAVKRTRGDLKGSAVCIQTHESNHVIIVEGPETAASLIGANANIYVTLGNIQNAAALGWLAKKHNTNTLHFAADNDGPKANNLKALQKVANQLDLENIHCTISLPQLESKCDFNDLLKTKGKDTVLAQLNNAKPLIPIKAFSQEALHQRLHINEWNRFKRLNHPEAKIIQQLKTAMDHTHDSFELKTLNTSYQQHVKQLLAEPKINTQVRKLMPKLYEKFRTQQPAEKPLALKEQTIDWRSAETTEDIKALPDDKTNNNIQHLKKLHTHYLKLEASEQAKLLERTMANTIKDIVTSSQAKTFTLPSCLRVLDIPSKAKGTKEIPYT